MSAVVAGVGMIPFAKPGRSDTYDRMGAEAARLALQDAGIELADIQQAYAGYVYADSAAGQTAIYALGDDRRPDHQREQLLRERIDGAVAGAPGDPLGRRRLRPGRRLRADGAGRDRHASFPIGRTRCTVSPLLGTAGRSIPRSRLPPCISATRATAYAAAYDMDPAVFALVAVKSRRHAAGNPYAVFRDPLTVEEVLASPHIYGPLTRLQCCPPTCGAAAAVLCTPEFAARHGIDATVRIRAQAMTERPPRFVRGRCQRAGRRDDRRSGRGRRVCRGRRGPARHPGRRGPRLLHDERGARVRGAPTDRGRHVGAVHPRRRQHLRRPRRDQSVRRAPVEGSPPRGDRIGAVRRARLAAARHGRPGQVEGARLALQHNSASAARASSRSTSGSASRPERGSEVPWDRYHRWIGRVNPLRQIRRHCHR